ncbi:hypothetical protein M422DRAFT_257366 [Sphaerobolus stellatus SS14]|uniref:Uncharacterized protein n=1 Tax=Sphaerobolus stellatus (strain SS14) TaxID=990650 RepID=A0A0C9VED8_SPHS4|nr:hypothetical protein M422DRAFT_257366 [Sphaerobolus stellatus SS14]
MSSPVVGGTAPYWTLVRVILCSDCFKELPFVSIGGAEPLVLRQQTGNSVCSSPSKLSPARTANLMPSSKFSMPTRKSARSAAKKYPNSTERPADLAGIANASPEELQAHIEHERAMELASLRAIARKAKKKLPDELPESFTNDVIQTCLRHLQEHGLSTTEPVVASTSAATSEAASLLPASVVQPTTIKPCDDGVSNYAIPVVSPGAASMDLDFNDENEDTVRPSYCLNIDNSTAPLIPAGEGDKLSPTLAERSGNDDVPPNVELALNDAQTPPSTNFGHNDDTDPLPPSNSSKEPVKRPGALTKEQLQTLRKKSEELDRYIEEMAQKFRVNAATITANMGLDNPQRRVLNFWNVFQSVFWRRVIDEQSALLGEDFDPEDLDAEAIQGECSAGYATLKLNDPDLTDEQLEERKAQREEIRWEYNRQQEQEEVQYREGQTAALMRQARREFTMRSKWYAARGVVIGGWGVSIDPYDPTSRTLSFVFVGSDAGHRYFEEQEVDISRLLYEFENFCSLGDMEARKRKGCNIRETLQANLQSKSNDKRKLAISEMMRMKWHEATGEQVTKIPWDDWCLRMIEHHQRTVGWPASVPWPSGPKPYSAIDRGKDGRTLAKAFTEPEGKDIRIEGWNEEEIALANAVPESQRADNMKWLKIALVVDDAGEHLLTIGDIKAQAKVRVEYQMVKRAGGLKQTKTKEEQKEDEDIAEALETEQPNSKKPATKVTTKGKARKDDGTREVNTKKNTGWIGYGKKRLREEKEENEEMGPRKRVRSKEYVELTDEEAGDSAAPAATNNLPKPKTQAPPIVKPPQQEQYKTTVDIMGGPVTIRENTTHAAAWMSGRGLEGGGTFSSSRPLGDVGILTQGVTGRPLDRRPSRPPSVLGPRPPPPRRPLPRPPSVPAAANVAAQPTPLLPPLPDVYSHETQVALNAYGTPNPVQGYALFGGQQQFDPFTELHMGYPPQDPYGLARGGTYGRTDAGYNGDSALQGLQGDATMDFS